MSPLTFASFLRCFPLVNLLYIRKSYAFYIKDIQTRLTTLLISFRSTISSALSDFFISVYNIYIYSLQCLHLDVRSYVAKIVLFYKF